MRALLDVNALIAAFDPGHVMHSAMMRWWQQNASHGWASCPLTQSSYLRVISQKSYARPIRLADAMVTLRRQINRSDHQFWADDFSIIDQQRIDHAHLLGAKQITDICLLAIAVNQGGRLATFDRGISIKAVKGAEPQNLTVIQ